MHCNKKNKKNLPNDANLAVTHTAQNVYMEPQVDNSYVLLWDFADLIHPMLKLETPHEIFCFRFNPSIPGVSSPPRLEITGPESNAPAV